jgi:carbon storage regulator CsrA
MLCISRFEGEVVRIGPDVRLTIIGIRLQGPRLNVKLGFDAPKHIQIDREEIFASKGGTLWQGPPAGVFTNGYLCEDKHGIHFSFEKPTWAIAADIWVSCGGTDLHPVIAWKFPSELTLNHRCIKVGPEAEKGVPCFKN